MRDPVDAALQLRRILRTHPERLDLRRELATLLRQQGLLEPALAQYVAIHEQNPDDRVNLEFLIWTGLECGRADQVSNLLDGLKTSAFQGLLEEAEARLLSEPQFVSLQFSVAYLYYREGLLRTALERFQPLTRDERWGAIAWNMLGLCYGHEKNFRPELAVECYRTSLELRDDRIDYRYVYFNLACAQYRAYQFPGALDTLTRLHRLDPGYPEVADWLSEVRELVAAGTDEPDGGAGVGARLRPRPPGPRVEAAMRPLQR